MFWAGITAAAYLGLATAGGAEPPSELARLSGSGSPFWTITGAPYLGAAGPGSALDGPPIGGKGDNPPSGKPRKPGIVKPTGFVPKTTKEIEALSPVDREIRELLLQKLEEEDLLFLILMSQA